MRTNPIKQLWKENKTALNAWITIQSSWTAEIMANAGLDAMTIDAQHGLASDYHSILPMLQAIATTKTVPFVRIPWNDPAYIMRMLDAGVYGLICPMLNNRQESEAFVQASKYPPLGFRSIGSTRASLHFGDDYFENANDELVTMAMIETADAMKNLDDIAQTANMDGLYVGPWDLSVALRLSKVADFDSVELLSVFDKILNACTKHGIVAGVQCPSPEVAIKMSEMGFKFVTAMNDTTLLKTAAQKSVEIFRNKITENTAVYQANPYA